MIDHMLERGNPDAGGTKHAIDALQASPGRANAVTIYNWRNLTSILVKLGATSVIGENDSMSQIDRSNRTRSGFFGVLREAHSIALTLIILATSCIPAAAEVVHIQCVWASNNTMDIIIDTDANTWLLNGKPLQRFTTNDGEICDYSFAMDDRQFSYRETCNGILAHSETIDRRSGVLVHYWNSPTKGNREQNRAACLPAGKPGESRF
jgi:hypothetical protein